MEKTYQLEVTETELNVIGAALGKMPYDAVGALIVKLKNQITTQGQVQPQVCPASVPENECCGTPANCTN